MAKSLNCNVFAKQVAFVFGAFTRNKNESLKHHNFQLNNKIVMKGTSPG